jgi:hypothetical protein
MDAGIIDYTAAGFALVLVVFLVLGVVGDLQQRRRKP